METKIPQTKNEAFAQLDEMQNENDKSELANIKNGKGCRLWEH